MFWVSSKNTTHWTDTRRIFILLGDKTCVNRIKPENLSEKEKGYLIGLFLGDGYAHHSKKDRHYNIDFYLNSVRDADIQEYLMDLMKKLNISPTVFKDPRYDMNRIRASSKQFFEFMGEKAQAFHATASKKRKQFLLGVVSGLIDSEGCVYRGTISLSQNNELLMRRVAGICGIWKVACSVREKSNPPGTIWRAYVATRFSRLDHVSRKVQRVYPQRLPGKPL